MSETNKIIKYTWTELYEISDWKQNNSSVLVTNVNGEIIKWKLSYGDINYLNFYFELACLSYYSSEKTVSFTIHLINGENIVRTQQYQFNRKYMSNKSWPGYGIMEPTDSNYVAYTCNIKLKDSDGVYENRNILFKNVSLKVICDITYEVPNVCIYNCSATPSLDHGSKKFDNLKNFFDSDKLSDVKIVAGGEEFRAHKLILSLRSKVFAAMFSHDMQETAESLVKVEDVDADVMREMLRFLYLDKIKDQDKLTGDLLAVADKYEIEDLKDWCEQELIKAVDLDNFHSIFALADMHRAQKLKKHLIDFLAKKTEECVKITNSARS